jgi:uncharacterized protein
MIKVVFDTVVFVRSLINPHSFCGKIVFAHSHRYRLFVSQPVVTELVEVLHRPELTSKFRTLAQLDLGRVIAIIGQAEVVDVPQITVVSRDPNDDKFLATAAAAQADYLVSEDQDLKVLEEHEGIKIIGAEEFLRILEQEAEKETR